MPAQKVIKTDGWQNLYTGLGIANRDKTQHTNFSGSVLLTEQELTDLYRGDGFAKRVVNLPADQMLREGFEVTEDDEDMIMAKLDELAAMKEIRKMLRWARLFGMGCIVMGIDDGKSDLAEPVDENSIRNVIFLRAFDRYRVTYTTADLYNDARDPNFGKVKVYNISPVSGVPFRCHHSRMLIVDGEDMPDLARVSNDGWGDSVIQSTYTQLRSMGSMYAGIEHIVDDFVQGTLSIQNLQELIASGQEAVILKRLQLIDMSRHLINTTLLDERETYEKHSSTVTGLPDLLDRYVQALSAVTGIPVTLLMGKSPAGLNATGDSDIRQWYDDIASKQIEVLKPPLEILIRYIFLSKEGAFKGREPENWSIKFNPLWQMSDTEKATIRKTVADADNVYLSNGVLTADEVAQSRFGGEEWSMDTELGFEREPEKYQEPEPAPAPLPAAGTKPVAQPKAPKAKAAPAPKR